MIKVRASGWRQSTALAIAVVVGAAALPAQAAGDAGGSAAVREPTRLHPELPSNAAFGASVAVDGDTVVAGAPGDGPDGDDSGSAFVFVADGETWTRQGRLTADSAPDDFFGYDVGLDGDTIVVGAPYHDVDGVSDTGGAYVFERSGTIWTQQAKLTPVDDERSYAGYSVAIEGDTAVVGAYGDGRGKVFVFTRSGATWTQQGAITHPDPTRTEFGYELAIDGDTLVVGEKNDYEGSVYVFVRSGDRWTQQAQLLPEEISESADFGTAVDVNADTVIVGARFDSTAHTYAGSVSIFVRDGTTWSQQAYLTQEEPGYLDEFGIAVSIVGNVAVIGSYKEDNPNIGSNGAAYIYRRSGSTWTQKHELLPPTPLQAEYFGGAVDISKPVGAPRTLVVGATNDDSSGSTYVYR